MSDSRHPKDYKEGPRKQMTRAWKLRVHEALAANKTAGKEPSTIAALARKVKGDKTGFGRMLDPDGDQTASTYVDDICDVLGIEQPLQETRASDDELERELDKIRQLPPEKQAALLAFLKTWTK